ncbi:MAG TPA: hypothetical protein VGN15_08705 [Ktedonobacteraceae bacterium]|jgi:hypothetical protein|nr:hypothetical protein [Ktedonobacteraceae bacterium]
MTAQLLDRTTGEIMDAPPPLVGEIVPWHEHSYSSLDDAEKSIYELLDQGEHLRLQQVRILLAIRDQQLYRERIDMTTGQPFVSFDAYIKKFISSSASFSGDAPRTLRSWLSRYLVYVDGLSLAEDVLVEMGSHFEVALPLAAKDRRCQLLEDDEELPTGGMRLGAKEFEKFVGDIQQKVKDYRDNPDIPEMRWTVKDTKAAVEEIMGTADSKVNFELDATLVGENVKWNGIVAFVGDIQYRPGDAIPLAMWAALSKGHKVVGIE